MNNFKDGGFKKKSNDFGGRPKFGGSGRGGGFGGSRGNGRPQAQSELFTTTCSACRKSCEVPFRPSGDKPVYCRECFGKKSQDNSRDDRGGSREFNRRDEGRREKPAFTQVPRESQPSRESTARIDSVEDLKKQLATIEQKLNTILTIINPPMPAKKTIVVAEKVAEGVALPKKERKPKVAVVKEKAVTPKKVVKKTAVKKVVKKAAKKATK